MEIEYSNEVKGKVFAYRFSKIEQKIISDALKPVVSKLHKQIEKIRNNPKNEGQATYQIQIEELIDTIKDIEEIREEFK